VTQGILLLSKPPGISSFKALSAVKVRLATRRVGHAGTLDPFARGLLVALVGPLTRLCRFAAAQEKEYIARILFGRSTDTLDPEGTQSSTGPVPDLGDVEAVLPRFMGVIRQVPPRFSAIHVGGRRAYEAARDGVEVSLPPRSVTIHGLQILAWASPELTVKVTCSTGTYIRALARDVAEAVGTCALLSDLTRTRIGVFRLEDAHPPGEAGPEHLLPASVLFSGPSGLPRLTVHDQWVQAVRAGSPPRSHFFMTPPVQGVCGAFAASGELLAVLENSGQELSYAAVFPGGGDA
jgi:tRNA pseudouridine55 synthase